jgi:hypothetical protein
MTLPKPSDYPFWFRVVVVTTLLLCAVNFFFFLAPLLAIATGLHPSTKDFAVWSGSLVATFLGAWLAFKFAAIRSDRERVDREVVAGNLALATVAEIWDQQKQFQRKVVDTHRGRFDAWFNLAVGTTLGDIPTASIRSDMAFLLQSAASVWQEVILEERRYRLVATLIKEREMLVLKEVWPRLEAEGLQMGQVAPETEIQRILGPGIVKQLTVKTSAISDFIDENVNSSFAAFKRLRSALKKIHPDRKFIELTPLS